MGVGRSALRTAHDIGDGDGGGAGSAHNEVEDLGVGKSALRVVLDTGDGDGGGAGSAHSSVEDVEEGGTGVEVGGIGDNIQTLEVSVFGVNGAACIDQRLVAGQYLDSSDGVFVVGGI